MIGENSTFKHFSQDLANFVVEGKLAKRMYYIRHGSGGKNWHINIKQFQRINAIKLFDGAHVLSSYTESGSICEKDLVKNTLKNRGNILTEDRLD
jgi:hypothetical protein